MYHYFNAITNKAGDALVGYYVRALDVNGNAVSIYADENGTPIVSVSGITDMAKVDANGNASFYIASGTYDLAIYAPDSTTLYLTVRNLPMQVLAIAGFKDPVRVATTAAGTLASDFENGDTVDGVVIETGDRILIKNQADATENGIYVIPASGAPARASDADSSAEMIGAAVVVTDGTVNAGKLYVADAASDFTLDTDNLAFAAPSGGLLASNNLSDVASASTSRTNLGVYSTSEVDSLIGDLQPLPLSFNFTGTATAIFRADEAMTLTEQDTSGTGSHSYEKSTSASPDTYSSTASPISLQAGAKLKVIATAGSASATDPYAVHMKRTA